MPPTSMAGAGRVEHVPTVASVSWTGICYRSIMIEEVKKPDSRI
jgi:hypothetical protein